VLIYISWISFIQSQTRCLFSQAVPGVRWVKAGRVINAGEQMKNQAVLATETRSFLSQIREIHRELGIAVDYAEQRGLQLIPECQSLVEAGFDAFSRPVRMEALTFKAWQAMQNAAASQGIELQLVSAFRSAAYQQKLLQNKLEKGLSLEQILQVNAAPGYSEHHSGRALDLNSPGYECLSEDFENSPAFIWLCQQAGGFGFSLSFPRNNPYGFLYEPWHWCYRSTPN